MKRVLIVYGTTEGHTRDVCQYIKDVVNERGAQSTIAEATREAPDPSKFDVCFIAASLHVGRYQTAVVDYACRHHAILTAKPSAFLSISLSAAGENPDDWEGLAQCVQRFTDETSWRPTAVHHVAGAIRYSHYDFFKRLALMYIARRRGQHTVSSRDYDLTDYADLNAFIVRFLAEHSEPRA